MVGTRVGHFGALAVYLQVELGYSRRSMELKLEVDALTYVAIKDTHLI